MVNRKTVWQLDALTALAQDGDWTLQTFMGNLTDGWIVGGWWNTSRYRSSVQRITYATTTPVTSFRTPIGPGREYPTAVSNTTDQWTCGGRVSGSDIRTITRITYASDTSSPVNKGVVSANLAVYPTSCGNTTDGWIFPTSTPSSNSSFDRITYANETSNPSARGNVALHGTGYIGDRSVAYGNNTEAWRTGGYNSSYFSTVSRLTYANDTATMTIRGSMSIGRSSHAFAGNATDGFIVSGAVSTQSGVDRIIYASDTTTALWAATSTSVFDRSATNNATDMWLAGGQSWYPNDTFSSIQRFEYASGTTFAMTTNMPEAIKNYGTK